MKTSLLTKTLAIAIGASCLSPLISPSAQAAIGYSTNFETGYTVGNGLSDQNGWVTNDPFNSNTNVGGSDAVITDGSIVGQLGGVYRSTTGGDGTPGRGDVTLTHGFDDPLAGGLGIRFDTDFSITSSTTSFPTKDTFGFTFLIGNTAYATLLFTPQTSTLYTSGPTDVPDNRLDISLTYAGNPALTSVQAILYNSVIHLTVLVDLQNNLNVTVDGLSVFDPANLDPSNATNPSQITSVGAVWNLKNPIAGTGTAQTNAGTNSIEFDNVSVVPEPSTTALLVLAGIGGMAAIMRRRKVSA